MTTLKRVLLGQLPEFLKDQAKRQYHRQWNKDHASEIRRRDRERKKAKYKNDEKYRNSRLQAERDKRRQRTEEQRKEDLLQRKVRVANYTEEQYERYRKKRAEACKRWREKQKLKSISKEGEHDGNSETYRSHAAPEK